MFGATGSTDCVARLNTDAVAFNSKMVSTARSLEKKLPGLKLVVLDIYNPLHTIITNPSPNGSIFISLNLINPKVINLTDVKFLIDIERCRILRDEEILLRDGDDRDVAPLQRGIAGDVHECYRICFLG